MNDESREEEGGIGLRGLISRWPRVTSALLFGAATTVSVHFFWYPSARMTGAAPALTLGIGIAHALAAAVIGGRLADTKRTPTYGHAALLGAATSLLAFVLFAPALAWWVSESDHGHSGILGFAALVIFTGFFSFLAVGWALLLISVMIALGIHWLSHSDPLTPDS